MSRTGTGRVLWTNLQSAKENWETWSDEVREMLSELRRQETSLRTRLKGRRRTIPDSWYREWFYGYLTNPRLREEDHWESADPLCFVVDIKTRSDGGWGPDRPEWAGEISFPIQWLDLSREEFLAQVDLLRMEEDRAVAADAEEQKRLLNASFVKRSKAEIMEKLAKLGEASGLKAEDVLSEIVDEMTKET